MHVSPCMHVLFVKNISSSLNLFHEENRNLLTKTKDTTTWGRLDDGCELVSGMRMKGMRMRIISNPKR